MPKVLNTLAHRVYVTDRDDPLLSHKLRSGGEVEVTGKVADDFLAVDGVVDAGSSAAKAWRKEHKAASAPPAGAAAPAPDEETPNYKQMKKAELVKALVDTGVDESEAKEMNKAEITALLEEPTGGGGTITTAKTPKKKG